MDLDRGHWLHTFVSAPYIPAPWALVQHILQPWLTY